MGLAGISKSTVSKLRKDIDERVAAFLNRALGGGWPHLWLDATYLRRREGGRIATAAATIAVACDAEGRRQIAGLRIGPSEAETFRAALPKGLVTRGLRGVRLVVPDAHEGLKAAIARVLGAAWQRCRAHRMRSALARVPKGQQGTAAPPPHSDRPSSRPTRRASGGRPELSFVQISDSHIGFANKPNPDPAATLGEAIGLVRRQSGAVLLVHTNDVSHLSRPAEFDAAERLIRGAGLDTHYVAGEHDVLVDDGHPFFARFAREARAGGWYSFDQRGVHFVAVNKVVDLRAGGLGRLGEAQLEWLEDDLRGRSASQPIMVFAHIPLWTVHQEWGWGTEDGARALGYLRRFGSVTVLNGHIHQVMQKVEGTLAFHTAMSTAFPQPAPGTAPSPGPVRELPAGRLRSSEPVPRRRLRGGGGQGELPRAACPTPPCCGTRYGSSVWWGASARAAPRSTPPTRLRAVARPGRRRRIAYGRPTTAAPGRA